MVVDEGPSLKLSKRGPKVEEDAVADYDEFDHDNDNDNDDDNDDDNEDDGGQYKAKVGRPRAKDKDTSLPRKPKAKPDARPVDGGAPTRRRRKSAGAAIHRLSAAKAPRENLTDAQKRENYIKSEQKRRTLIKEGFDDMCEIVPGLRGGGFSKSTMLTMASEWLEDVLRGNETLEAQLHSF